MEKYKGRRRFLKCLLSMSAFGAGSLFSFRFKAGHAKTEDVTGNGLKETAVDSPKIDAFTHIAPKEYVKAVGDAATISPLLSDLDQRFRSMDELGNIRQLLTLGGLPIEEIAGPEKAVDFAKAANDGMAALVSAHPDRFAGAAACLPMNNLDAAMKELERAVEGLKLCGILIYTSINGKSLDSPEFMPLYEKMATYDLPIWLHPFTGPTKPYYPGEQESKYNLAAIVGWPHATTMAMVRLAGSGLFERLPNLKFLTHHAGGTVPYLIKRIEHSPFTFDALSRPVTDSLQRFYNDTAVQGNTANLMCARAFCGADHMLFGTDFPMADVAMVKRVIQSIEEMEITHQEKRAIFSENALKLCRLNF